MSNIIEWCIYRCGECVGSINQMEIVSFRNLHQKYCCFYKNTSRYRIEKINLSRLSILFGASVFTRKIMRILRRSSLIGTVICVNFKHTRLESLYILAGCLLSGATILNTNWHVDNKKSIEYKLRMTGCEIVIQDDMSSFNDGDIDRLAGVLYISLYEIFTPAIEDKCNSLATYLSPFDAAERAKSDSSIQRMLNQQMKESMNIPPDTIHMVTFSSGSDSEHSKASKIQYQHLQSCYERLELMGKWDQKEPLIMLIANPIYEPFTSIIISYSLYRPNTTLHLLQRYTATYWKIIWEMNEYYKHMYHECSYKIFTSLYPRQLEALLTLDQVAKECSLFDPIIDYDRIIPVPPQDKIDAVCESEPKDIIDDYSNIVDKNMEQWEGFADSSDMRGSNSPGEILDQTPIEACTDGEVYDTLHSDKNVKFPESSGIDDMMKTTKSSYITSGSGEFLNIVNRGRRRNITTHFPTNLNASAIGSGLANTFLKFDKLKSMNKFGKSLSGEWLLKNKLKPSNWPITQKFRFRSDRAGKSESVNKDYVTSKTTPLGHNKRTESMTNILQSKKASTYIPKLRMKFSELRSVLSDKNTIFSLGGAPICPETCYTFSNVCKGKISILYYGSTETIFPLIHSSSTTRERDEILNIMKMGWTHEYQGLPCRGHYLGRPFDESDNIKIVKSVDKTSSDFMSECDPGEPGYIICKANINCQLCETRIHDDNYLGLDDVGFYLNAQDNGVEVREFFWMHKVDLSLCENYSWKFRLTQTSRMIQEFICDLYDIQWNKVYVITFGLMHGTACIYCCAVELVYPQPGPDEEPDQLSIDLDEISKDISDNLLDRCHKSDAFKNLVLPDVLRVGSIPSTYKGTPDMKLLKETFKTLI